MEVLHPVAPQSKPHSHLALGIAVSLGLHLAISALLLGSPQGARSTPSIAFIDLKDVQIPAAMPTPAPAPTPTPVPAPAPATPPIPSTTERVEPAAKTEAPEQAAESAVPAASHQETPPPAAAQPTQEEVEKTGLGLGMTRGYFRSIGNGESLRDSVRGYYLEMLQRINERWWVDQGVDKKQIGPILVSLLVARSGEIVEAQLIRGSGNPRYDRAVLAALKGAGPLPPLPAEYRDPYFLAPIQLVPPLNLMSW